MKEKKHKVKIETIKSNKNKNKEIGDNALKNETGITLLTLAIMILIIIILAGITISATLGDNGLLSQAQGVKDMAEGSVNEYTDKMQGALNEYQDIMRESLNLQISESHTTENITIEVETTSSENLMYEFYINGELKATQSEPSYTQSITLENKDPYIPSGFTHTEGTVDTGYVIQDTNIGNEFVWIPVKSGTYTAYVIAKNSEGNEGRTEELTIEISELTREINGETYSEWEEEEGNINNKKSVAYFKHSVVENSGFYFGRYEMGMPGQKSGDAPVLDFTNEARNIEGVPVCVARVMPWTNIDWSTAKKNLESMYNGEVQSAMMNSYARTTTLNWILDTGAKTLTELQNSGSWGIYMYGEGLTGDVTFRGNYYGIDDGYYRSTSYESILNLTGYGITSIQIDTGADTKPEKLTAVNNIYDLAGNTAEWSTEKRIDGSGYRESGGSFQVSFHTQMVIDFNTFGTAYGTTGSISISSRPILYK